MNRNPYVLGYGRSAVEKNPDPYNNPYTGHENYVSIFYHGKPVNEGDYFIPYLSMNNPLPYDLSVEVRTTSEYYKEANYKYQGQDYADMHKTFVIPAGQTQIDLSPIKIHQNPDPLDLPEESFLVEIVTESVPPGIKVGNGSVKATIVNVPTSEMSPEIIRGTQYNDVFYGKPGNKIFVGEGGEDQVNYNGTYSVFDDSIITEFPDRSIELNSPHYGKHHLYDVEYIWDRAAFQLMRTKDLFTDVNLVEGTHSSDILWATDTIDHLVGKQGNDYLVANIGNNSNDVLDGDQGYDYVVYVNPGDISEYDFVGKDGQTQMVSVNNKHNGSTDTLYDVEGVIFLEADAHYNIIDYEVHSIASLIA